MAQLVLAPLATLMNRTVGDFVHACTSSGLATIAREGSNPQILGALASSTAKLVPKAALVEGLKFSHPLEGTFQSPFLANFLGVQQPTTQQALLQLPAGQTLVIYVTALAAATTSTSIRGLLREHLAVALDLPEVGDIPESTYRTCVHPATLQILQRDVATYVDRCTVSFAATETYGSHEASNRELAAIAVAFSIAQSKGPNYWVRVRNVKGAEALCAALGAAFGAHITIGFINAIKSLEASVTAASSRADMPDSAQSATSTSLSIRRTSIRFEYDQSGVATIGICEAGGSVAEYVVPGGARKKLSRNSMLVGEILPHVKVEQDRLQFSLLCKVAIAANVLSFCAHHVESELQNVEHGHRSITSSIVDKWMEAFMNEISGSTHDIPLLRSLLVQASNPSHDSTTPRTTAFTRWDPETDIGAEVERLAGPEEVAVVKNALHDGTGKYETTVLLVISLLKILFGSCYTGLELRTSDLRWFNFGDDFLERLFDDPLELICPYYGIPIPPEHSFSRCCSVVQCGGYVLMPRILAEESLRGLDSSIFTMVPGHLAKDGVPVKLFLYNERPEKFDEIEDLRPQMPVPSDASDSATIEYMYEETEYGYLFWTVEANHRLNLNGLMEAISRMHAVDDSYAATADHSTWHRAAPHHVTPLTTTTRTASMVERTLYLSFNNNAGRRLALSRAGDTGRNVVLHFGVDYRRALAYAEDHHYDTVVL
jgi:hypothetical protein